MNERIKLLAEQAGFNPYNYQGSNLALFEKFAELIVQECAGFLRDTLDDHFAAEQLVEHFGVE
jgi:hypothetical protein